MARPKREFTDREIRLIKLYALNGGKNNTIAMALDMPVNTLTNRFSKLLKKYRAKRKLKLRHNQTKQARTSTEMSKFLGKNELGQKDKQDINQTSDQADYNLTPEQEAIYKKAAADILRLKVKAVKAG